MWGVASQPAVETVGPAGGRGSRTADRSAHLASDRAAARGPDERLAVDHRAGHPLLVPVEQQPPGRPGPGSRWEGLVEYGPSRRPDRARRANSGLPSRNTATGAGLSLHEGRRDQLGADTRSSGGSGATASGLSTSTSTSRSRASSHAWLSCRRTRTTAPSTSATSPTLSWSATGRRSWRTGEGSSAPPERRTHDSTTRCTASRVRELSGRTDP